MAYQASVTSNITRNTTSASGATFNFPIFCAAHAYFKERVRSYSSWAEFKDDTDIVSGSNTYNAVRLAFSQSPAPSTVYVGRQLVDDATVTPEDAVIGKTYGVTIKTYDTTTGLLVDDDTLSFTATTAVVADVVTGLLADVSSPTGYTATGTTDITITPTAGHQIVVVDLVNMTDAYTSTETAAELLAAIQDESNDWYFMTWEDHTEASILAMAAEIEATGSDDYPKMYFTSTSDADSIVAVVDPAIDVIGKLKALGYDRTECQWHDQADTLFPEMGITAANSTYQPGGITWKFTQINGVDAAADPLSGKALSTQKQGNINARNGSWMGIERGVTFYHEGKVTGGEWIDVIRGADWLNDQIEVALLNLLLNQRGGKIPFTPAGMQQVANTIDNVLTTAVNVGFLYGFEKTTVPNYGNIAFADKVARILENVNWTGYLAGAVHNIVTNGNLTYADAELV